MATGRASATRIEESEKGSSKGRGGGRKKQQRKPRRRRNITLQQEKKTGKGWSTRIHGAAGVPEEQGLGIEKKEKKRKKCLK